jgi:hypothetical protein
MAFFRGQTTVESFEIGVVRFEFSVFPCSPVSEAVLSPDHAKHKTLIKE